MIVSFGNRNVDMLLLLSADPKERSECRDRKLYLVANAIPCLSTGFVRQDLTIKVIRLFRQRIKLREEFRLPIRLSEAENLCEERFRFSPGLHS